MAHARAMLARASDWPVDDLPMEAVDLIGECGRLPLALAMTGAMLRRKAPAYWSHVLQLLSAADLGRVKVQLPHYRYSDLRSARRVSVEALNSKTHGRYLKLAVLLAGHDSLSGCPAGVMGRRRARRAREQRSSLSAFRWHSGPQTVCGSMICSLIMCGRNGLTPMASV
jgi:hypothetical protein